MKTRIDLDATLRTEEHFLLNFETMTAEEQILRQVRQGHITVEFQIFQQKSLVFTPPSSSCQTSTSPPDLTSPNLNSPAYSKSKSPDENGMPFLSPIEKIDNSMMIDSSSRVRKK